MTVAQVNQAGKKLNVISSWHLVIARRAFQPTQGLRAGEIG